MGVKITPVKDSFFKVMFGLIEIGNVWKVQSSKVRVFTYGCKVFVNDTLEAEFPIAKNQPYCYELVSDGPVVWEIRPTATTWIDQPVKELVASQAQANVPLVSIEEIFYFYGSPAILGTARYTELLDEGSGTAFHLVFTGPGASVNHVFGASVNSYLKVEGLCIDGANRECECIVTIDYGGTNVHTFRKRWSAVGYDKFIVGFDSGLNFTGATVTINFVGAILPLIVDAYLTQFPATSIKFVRDLTVQV